MQDRELKVFRPEIVAPLGHAVRLVQGEQADFCALQQVQEARGHQTPGRHIDQVQFAALDLPFDLHASRQSSEELR